jgi:Mg/Co/Ni transporter MgtE
MWTVFIVIGLIFGILAGMMAYVITYGEYVHHYPDKKQPRKIALQAGFFAFAFLFGLSMIAGYLLVIYLPK